MKASELSRYRAEARKTAARQRGLQKVVDRRKVARKSTRKPPAAPRARRQPQNPFPRQHLAKPGLESALKPAPNFAQLSSVI